MSEISAYLIDTLIFTAIFAILALSLNLEAGLTRLMNFGKVAFFAIGAYSSAILTLKGYSFVEGALAGIIIAALVGLLIALPAIRLREDYLAIATIAFGEIIRMILLNERWLTKGPIGLRGIPRPLKELGIENYHTFYLFFTLFFLLIVYLIMRRISNSPYGRNLRAIREDELVARTLGKNSFKFKAQVFALASVTASLAGSLFAHYLTYISPDMFMPTVTFSVWTMLVIGGMGNINGALLGALLIRVFERSTRLAKDYIDFMDPANLRMIVLGLLLIIFIMYRPQGLVPEKRFEYEASED